MIVESWFGFRRVVVEKYFGFVRLSSLDTTCLYSPYQGACGEDKVGFHMRSSPPPSAGASGDDVNLPRAQPS